MEAEYNAYIEGPEGTKCTTNKVSHELERMQFGSGKAIHNGQTFSSVFPRSNCRSIFVAAVLILEGVDAP